MRPRKPIWYNYALSKRLPSYTSPMPTVLIIKYFHIAFAVITAVSMVVRGAWRITGSPLLRQRWVRRVPHINDTLLFSTGIAMLVYYKWWPFDIPWLTVKLIALLVYIGLGFVALRRGGRLWVRAMGWGAALTVLAYIFSVALTKTPLPLV